MICPFIVDQPLWGARVHELGVEPKPIPQKRLTAEKLAEAIREVPSVTSIYEKAEILGEKIRKEDGTGNAIEILERIAQR